MSGADRDPRDALPRELAELLDAAWAEHRAPPAAPELARADHATRRGVAWLRAAWAQARPAPVATPAAARRWAARRRRRAGRPAPLAASFGTLLTLRRHVAAALLLVTLGALLRLGHPAPRPSPPRAPQREPPAATPERPRVIAANDQVLELRSGPVRLVLLTSPASPPPPTPAPSGRITR